MADCPMKIARMIVILSLAFFFGFLVVRWSQAKPIRATPVGNDVYIQELESLENYLHDTGQTNALKQLFDVLADDRTSEDGVDLALTVAVLQGLRDGKTNEMLKFFEHHLDAQISVFASEYRDLPGPLQKQMSLKPLQSAKDYRSKYPVTNPYPVWAEGVTNAFKLPEAK